MSTKRFRKAKANEGIDSWLPRMLQDNGYMSHGEFKRRIKELLAKAQRLMDMEVRGFEYRRVRVEKTRVKAHTRRAHWAMRPMKRKP